MLRQTILLMFLMFAPLHAAVPETQTVTYTADDTTDLMNPERGWHKNVTLIGGDNFAAVRNSSGMSLARTYVRLDDYRDSALPQSMLDEHTLRFAQVRAAGIKLVLRYSYNFGMESDAPLDRVLQHIEQLKPYWRANADVIATLQAGFIGAWGEWHSSTNNLDSDANKATIASALLAAMPTSRMIQIRYPASIRTLFPTPVSAAQAFGTSAIARVGFMNDSFLRNITDAGTYATPSWDFDPALKQYAADMSPFVVMGGETVDVPWTEGNRQAGPAAMAEMAQLHWDYLNRDFELSVINPWIADGTYAQMTRKMGYRLRLASASLPRAAASGSMLEGIQLNLANDGWGKVYNPRRLDLILRHTQSGVAHRVELSADARRLLPLAGESRSVLTQGQLPTLANGTYTVLLHLGDPEAAILARPEYSIRLANQNLWESATGYHALGMTLEIQGSAPSNAAPQVSAGPDRSVTQPNAANLAGTASDDGLPSGSTLSVTWTTISGPGTVTFAQSDSAATTATFSQAGTYVLQLAASDGALVSQDSVTVVVSAAPPVGGNPPTGTGTGLTGTYFPSRDFTGTSSARTDATVAFNWDQAAPVSGIPADNFSVRWTGQVQAQVSETYTFTTLSDDGVRLWVNGQQLVNNWTDHGPTEDSGSITLVAGEKYGLTLEFYENAGGAVAQLSWASPSTAKQIIPMSQLFPSSVTPGALPAGWTAQDVGGVALTGSTTQSNGTWTVSGSGSDIWNNADSFQFASQRITGDLQMTAQVNGLTNTDGWAKAGVMIRESLTAGSRHASTFATAGSGLAFQRRVATAGASSHTAGPGSPTPYWVRIERVGNVVISSTSPNGTAWTEVRRETIAMSASIYVGLAVTSHNNAVLCTATFTNVQVVGVAAVAN